MPTILISHNATYTLSVIGPLTTAFKPSSSCFSTLFQTTSNEVVLAPLGLTGCYPSGFSAAFATTSVSLAYYSPGICPSGYAHATPVIDGLLGADETGVYCCPCGFSFPTTPLESGLGSTCTSALTTPTFLYNAMGTAAVSTGVVWAPAMAVVWKREDFPASVTPTRGHRRLATVIVVPVVVVLLLVVAAIVYSRRHRHSMVNTFPGLAPIEINELPSDPKSHSAPPVVLPVSAMQQSELPDAPIRGRGVVRFA